MSGGDQKIKVTDYYAALQVGICHGPVDAVSQILIGEKYIYPIPDPYLTAFTYPQVLPDGETINVAVDWQTQAKITANTQFLCWLPFLFGGDDHEGGCIGQIGVLLGGEDQVVPDWWAGHYGCTSVTSPGYRGQCTAYFGHYLYSGLGFLWATNSPVMRETWFTVQRAPKGLNTINRSLDPIPVRRERNADIIDPETGDTTSVLVYDMFVAGPNANGVHIIYECLIDTDFGLGHDPSEIDVDSFNAAAATVYAEGIGLSFAWTQQTTIEEFINEVEHHLDGKLFTNPATGKLTFRLVRAPTTYDGVFEITPDNSVVTNFQRKALTETISEVAVSWTNPWNEDSEVSLIQSLAAANLAGYVEPHSVNYRGARDPVTATKLGARDLRTGSYPLAQMEVTVNRKGWGIVPTDILKATYPEYGLDGVYFRVAKVNYGKPGESSVKLTLVEDIFSIEASDYYYPGGSKGGGDTIDPPRAMQFKRGITVPAYWLASNTLLSGLDPSQAYIAVLASQPIKYNLPAILNEQKTQANGDAYWSQVGSIKILGRSYLGALPAKATSTLTSLGPLTGGDPPLAGWFGVIGEVGDDECEIVMMQYVDTTGPDPIYYLVRGCFDTIPRSWPDHTACYWIETPTNSFDKNKQTIGATVSLKLQSRTPSGTLAIGSAPSFGVTVGERPHLPNRPANVLLNGAGFGQDWVLVAAPPGGANPFVPAAPSSPIDGLPLVDGLPKLIQTTVDDLVVSWSRRNRQTEDGRVLNWFDGDTTPESGQTTHIRLEELDGTLIAAWDSAGTSQTIPAATASAHSQSRLLISSERDSMGSLQVIEFLIEVPELLSRFDSTVTTFDSTALTWDAT